MVSKSPEMMDALRELYDELLRYRWEVHSEWISTTTWARTACQLSRVTDDVDWQLNRCVFAALGGQRLFDTDRFASETNALAERFNSRWACPGTAGVDALLQDDGHNCVVVQSAVAAQSGPALYWALLVVARGPARATMQRCAGGGRAAAACASGRRAAPLRAARGPRRVSRPRACAAEGAGAGAKANPFSAAKGAGPFSVDKGKAEGGAKAAPEPKGAEGGAASPFAANANVDAALTVAAATASAAAAAPAAPAASPFAPSSSRPAKAAAKPGAASPFAPQKVRPTNETEATEDFAEESWRRRAAPL